MSKRPKHLESSTNFPKLTKNNHDVTSDQDTRYNCIAFAAGVTNKKYWPTFHPDAYWPPGLPRVEKIDSFIKLFESLGYTQIKGPKAGSYQAGVEKVAIFAAWNGSPTHAARQLGPNWWASKLGNSYDIEHKESAVSGGTYGEMIVFMGRSKAGPSPSSSTKKKS